MDMRMVDNEDQRDDRKVQAGGGKPEMTRLPNRRQRRLIAKRRGVFKHPGAWPYINNGAKKNQPINGDKPNENQN